MSIILLLANLAGAIVYVVAASLGWAIPQERGLDATTGEPFVWALAVFPILALFAATNLIWGVVILWRRHWRSGRFWLGAACVWTVAVVIDFAHH